MRYPFQAPEPEEPETNMPETETAPSQDEKKVLDWRVEQFRKLEFGEAVSELLAGSDVDLNRARKMRDRGCDTVLALRILL